MKAWHFTSGTLRDGQPIPAIGETLKHDGKLVMCRSGLHASKRIIDALNYAPGWMIHRVECRGELLQQDDKLVCTERTILWSVDGKELLRKFARLCALDVIDLWDAPDVVAQYLKTGDAELQSEAAESAWSAAWSAWSAAEEAAKAAWSAESARSAAWSAAWSAAKAARSATWSAARSAQNRRLTRMVNYAHNKGK